MGVFDVDGGAEPPRVPGDVVGEDDAPHRRLAGTRLAHEQHLLLHGGDLQQITRGGGAGFKGEMREDALE